MVLEFFLCLFHKVSNYNSKKIIKNFIFSTFSVILLKTKNMSKTGNKTEYIHSTRSVMRVLEASFKNHWSCPALTDYGTGISFTYEELANQIHKTHEFFRKEGIEPGDRIALCDKNSSYWAVCYLSALTYGAVVVPILPDFHGDQIVNVLNHSESKMAFLGENIRRRVRQATTSVAGGNIHSCHILDLAMMGEKAELRLRPEDVRYFDDEEDAMAMINYTSGSTGHSKGVMIPYRAIWSNIAFADEKLGLQTRCTTLSLLPMAHMYGFSFEFSYEISLGGHIYFLTRTPSPSVLAKALSDVKPDIAICVPLIVEKIVQSRIFPKLKSLATQSLIALPFFKDMIFKKIRQRIIDFFGGNIYEVIVGGAPLNKDVEEFLHYIKFPYTVGYGMTECAPIICYRDYKTYAKNSCGEAAPRMEVKILSDDPEHVEGEIVTRGTNVMLGYYKNEDATREAIDPEGWLHTGDLGTMDKQGNVYIRGRQKNMILGANGQNIYPEEIEEKFTSNTLVDECVVVKRENQLVGLVYTTDDTLRTHGMTRDEFNNQLEVYLKRVNAMLPNFYKVSRLAPQDLEFEKTPKGNIKRFLYT